ncbi:MAG: hypothetical protein NZO16_05425, partial [Deltaproteobacteria bacterium]|nr:hypothetical protein [Deltaproteobacteria bacterium]
MDLFKNVVSLCKRRGFVFQTAEVYGGARSLYDFAHLGYLLKYNIAEYWIKNLMFNHEDILFLDGTILLPYQVVKASGHVDNFADPMVDCKVCRHRFRPDKVEKELGELKCPICGSKSLTDIKFFNLMFKTSLGPVERIDELVDFVLDNSHLDRASLKKLVNQKLVEESVYLRPETAQSIFSQFLNLSRCYPKKLPFGIAQIGKAFRNEVTTEKFLFRVAEFEQMEVEFFIKPETEQQWFDFWIQERFAWWRKILNDGQNLRIRHYDQSELAHYASRCADIEFKFPWGFDEVEGIASRTDFDLSSHEAGSGKEHSVFEHFTDGDKTKAVKIKPWVIEPSCGLTRAFLAVLLDAYSEEEGKDATGETKIRTFLRLKPFLSPIKVAVLPLVKNDKLINFGKR